MPGLLPNVDPDGLLEFSVVYTDRALNHMSKRFQGVMTDISAMLKRVYKGPSAVLVPGSGTFGMESVARQFAHGKHVLVIRNGWFSYRWTQIFEMGGIPASHTVLKARRVAEEMRARIEPVLARPGMSAVAKLNLLFSLGAKLKRGELTDIVGVTTSFQGEVLAAELGIPLQSLNAVDRIDLAIDGADEVVRRAMAGHRLAHCGELQCCKYPLGSDAEQTSPSSSMGE